MRAACEGSSDAGVLALAPRGGVRGVLDILLKLDLELCRLESVREEPAALEGLMERLPAAIRSRTLGLGGRARLRTKLDALPQLLQMRRSG
mmetsp:Transcript_79198/g.137316  ORF Transcript_79198/g.137316 Transcript_79198/m.137316 type:complete len:91 (+) Transcript_79198:104-376(+)